MHLLQLLPSQGPRFRLHLNSVAFNVRRAALKKLNKGNDGHKAILRLGGVGKAHGGLLILMKVTMEMNQVLIEQGDLLNKYLEQFFRACFFLNSITLLQMDRLQLTAVYCNRRILCKYNTSKDVFSWCKSAHRMATGKSDDQRIQPDNKLELGTSYKLKLGPR